MNIVIKHSKWLESDIPLLFAGEPVIFSEANDLPTLMLEQKIYQSKSQAIKAGRQGPIPTGWNVMKASKKVTIYLWNPSE